MLYTETNLQAIQAQQKKRWMAVGIPAAACFVGMIVCFILRIEWATAACTAVGGVILMAGWDLFIKPLKCYERHLKAALHGRRAETTLAFSALDHDESIVDGVRYYSFMLTDYDKKGQLFDCLFYYDAELPRPDYKPGDMLHITYYDKMICSVDRA